MNTLLPLPAPTPSQAAILLLVAALAPGCTSTRPDDGGDPDAADTGTDVGAGDVDAADTPGVDASDADLHEVDDETSDAVDDAPDSGEIDEEVDASDAAEDSVADTTTDDADSSDTSDEGATDTDPDVPPAAWLRVGTGYDPTTPYAGYTPLGDGDPVRIAEGPQGGFHVWGGFEGSGMATRGVESEWTLTTADGTIIGGGFFVSEMRAYGDHLATAGLTVFLDIALDVTTLDGPRYELCATVYLPDDSTLTDCRSVTTSCCDYL